MEYTAQKIITHNGWDMVNIREISENELLTVADQHGLESDPQTRDFCKFIAIGTNFASLDFQSRLQTIPVLVNSIKDLITKMQEEINEFADIANFFQTLIQAFLKVVMNTKHSMKMVEPHLDSAVVHMEIMSDALAPDSNAPLSTEDLKDVEIALTNMSSGIVKLLEHARSSNEQSVQLDKKINDLKENIENKIVVVEKRIGFGNILPKLGATLGMIAGVNAANMAVESIAFGGAGAVVLGGFSFPPLGAILLGLLLNLDILKLFIRYL